MFKSTYSNIPGYRWVEVSDGVHHLCEDVTNPTLSSFVSVTDDGRLDSQKREAEFHLLREGIIYLPPETKFTLQMQLIKDGIGYCSENNHKLADGILCDALRSMGHSEIVDIYEQIFKWYE